MAILPSDYSIIGTVLAIAVAIILLSGLALYLAFRVRETLHDEKGGGARAAKVAFMIGLLFLSGGVFYFFASGLGGPGVTSLSSVSGSSTTTSSIGPNTSITTSTSSTSTYATSTTASVSGSPVSMGVTYPTSVTVGQGFYVQFNIYNNGAVAASGATIDVGNMVYTFSIQNATECNPQCSSVTWSGSVVNVGTLYPGETIVTLGLKAPASPAQYSGTTTLYYQGQTQPTTVTIAIRVSGRP